MKNSLSISDASIKTGLSQKQLRDYEAKGYIDEPIKIRCGCIKYRRFSPEHIEAIKIFKKFIDDGFTLAAASQKTREYLGKEGK